MWRIYYFNSPLAEVRSPRVSLLTTIWWNVVALFCRRDDAVLNLYRGGLYRLGHDIDDRVMTLPEARHQWERLHGSLYESFSNAQSRQMETAQLRFVRFSAGWQSFWAVGIPLFIGVAFLIQRLLEGRFEPGQIVSIVIIMFLGGVTITNTFGLITLQPFLWLVAGMSGALTASQNSAERPTEEPAVGTQTADTGQPADHNALEVCRRFTRVRRRQRSILFLCIAPLAVVMFFEDRLPAGFNGRDAILLALGVTFVAYGILTVILFRCPACRRVLNVPTLSPENCPYCGAGLTEHAVEQLALRERIERDR